MEKTKEVRPWHALLAGGCAGLSADMVLFPLDTIKTRLQSAQGFYKAGGFRGIYAGLPSAAAGSIPNASLFFLTYESVKRMTGGTNEGCTSHMLAASCGEVMACLIRVPTEIVKQRAQASAHHSTRIILLETFREEGFIGFYRGYSSTVIREIPFSVIQFPLWEYFKSVWSNYQGQPALPWQSSVSGALAGGIAAAVTTPLDVAKTRIMLAKTGSAEAHGGIINVLQSVYLTKGLPGLFAGLVPRTLWISFGGAIFLGIYDKVCCKLSYPGDK